MDGDVGSSPFGLFEQAGTVAKAGEVAGDIEGVKGTVGEIAENPLEAGKTGLKQILLEYTHSKKSLIASFSSGLEYIDKAVDKAAKRVDMWRMTKPTLIGYYKSARRLVDDTKQLMHDFKWKRLIDPERKWDKRREKLFDANKDGSKWRGRYVNLYTSFSGYLMSFVGDTTKAKGDRDKIKKNMRATFVPNIDADEIMHVVNAAGEFDSSKIPNLTRSLLPLRTLEYSADAMFALKMLEADYYGRDTTATDTMETLSKNLIEKIENHLGNTNQTLVDGMELSGYIALQRSIVKKQTVRIAQLRSQLDIMTSNLYLANEVARQESAMSYEQSLQILIGGKEIFEEYQRDLANLLERGQ